MLSNIFNNKPLPIYAKGKNSREWIYVEDHCEALFRLYLKGKIGKSYNVGSGVNLRNIDLVKRILGTCKSMNIKIGNKTKIKFVTDRPGHDFRYALSSKRIIKDLKWNQKKDGKNEKNNILKYVPDEWSNYEAIIADPQFVDNIKLSKIFKNANLSFLFDYRTYLKKKQNIKFHFQVFHGKDSLEKAINLLDDENREPFRNKSVISDVCTEMICGKGKNGYLEALKLVQTN